MNALHARNEWFSLHRRPRRRNTNGNNLNVSRAMKLASDGQYSRAMRAISNSPMADINSGDVLQKLKDLHPTPTEPIRQISRNQLPPTPEITEAEVLRAARSMNPASAPGPDCFSPRLIRLLAFTSISPQAGVTGLGALTNLVRRLAKGNLPHKTLPLFAAATLLPIKPRPHKIRPIAIGQALRRLTTKVLLGPALADTRDYFAPCQLANGVSAGADAIVHDVRMKIKRYGKGEKHVLVAVDASNAFNCFSRQQMLDLLPSKAPSLAAFINMVYGLSSPHSFLHAPKNHPRLSTAKKEHSRVILPVCCCSPCAFSLLSNA